MRAIIEMTLGSALAATAAAALAQPAGLQSDVQAVVNSCVTPEQRSMQMSDLTPAQRLTLIACFQREAARQINAQVPYRIDQGTVLRAVTVEGAELTYLNDVDVDAAQISDAQRAAVIQSTRGRVCAQENMRTTMGHGGAYRYIWRDRAGVEIARTTIAGC